jgi:hypothetical protein
MASVHEPPNPMGTTTTNPLINDYKNGWRWGWGNTLSPSFIWAVPANDKDAGEFAIDSVWYRVAPARPDYWLGFIYSELETDLADTYYHDMTGETQWPVTLNMSSIVANPPADIGAFPIWPGANSEFEGPFELYFRYTTLSGGVAWTANEFFGIDLTKPDQVTGVEVRPQVGYPSADDVMPSNRVHVTWDDRRYDALSGTGYFEVMVDGKPYSAAGDDGPLRIFDAREQCPGLGIDEWNTPRTATVEFLRAGRHTVQMRAVDRGTNVGPASDAVEVITDPDVPTVELTLPWKSQQLVGKKVTFTATARDAGGVRSVRFYVDGNLAYTDSTAPYAYSRSTDAYSQNSVHNIQVVVEDMYGRTVSDSGSFKVDKVAPKVTSLSDTPDPFCPRLQDGYKDNSSIKFSLSERANVQLLVYKSDGTLWRSITKTFDAGSRSFTWNGKSNSGKAAGGGTYKYKLQATDERENSSSTGWAYTHVKTYDIVQTSAGSVTIIPR